MLFGCNFIITFSAVAVTINKEVIMGTRNTFKVLFYIKKNAPLRNGNTPIMGRITINGQRTQLSTRLSVDPKLWNVNMGRVTGRRADAVRVNEQLSQIRYHIERCYNTLFYEHAQVTPQMVKADVFRQRPPQRDAAGLFPGAQRGVSPDGRHQPQQDDLLQIQECLQPPRKLHQR